MGLLLLELLPEPELWREGTGTGGAAGAGASGAWRPRREQPPPQAHRPRLPEAEDQDPRPPGKAPARGDSHFFTEALASRKGWWKNSSVGGHFEADSG